VNEFRHYRRDGLPLFISDEPCVELRLRLAQLLDALLAGCLKLGFAQTEVCVNRFLVGQVEEKCPVHFLQCQHRKVFFDTFGRKTITLGIHHRSEGDT
jgi:hypothetical protein